MLALSGLVWFEDIKYSIQTTTTTILYDVSVTVVFDMMSLMRHTNGRPQPISSKVMNEKMKIKIKVKIKLQMN